MFGQPLSLEGADRESFGRLPRAYIVCNEDRAIPPALQRRMLADVGCEPVIELDTDHCPWLSRGDEFVAALDEAVETITLASTH